MMNILGYNISEECNHLKTGQDQYNAYLTDDNKLCCMCGPGKHWSGNCNSTNPKSTVCTECHFNLKDKTDRYYISYTNVRPECFHQISSCVNPKILDEGSTEVEAKCVCPPGMVEKHRQCIDEVKTTNEQTLTKPASTPTISSYSESSASQIPVTSELPQTTKSFIRRTSSKSPGKLIKRFSTQSAFISDEPTTGYKHTRSTPISFTRLSNETGNPGLSSAAVGFIIGGVIIIIVLIVFFLIQMIRKYKCNGNRQSGEKSPYSTPMTSRDDLINVESGRTEDNDLRTDNLTFQGTPEMPNKSHPFNRPVVAPPVMEYPIRPDRNAPEVQALLGAENNVNDQAFTNYHDEFTSDQRKNFALDLATMWSSSIRFTEVKPVYRLLFKSKAHDNVIDALERQHSRDFKEFVYQLMVEVHHSLGQQLTPRYILQKLELVKPRPAILIQLTQEALDNWRPDPQ